ncbi:MAG: hypothetical protein WC558_17010, partial [Patulibacter sp.]
HIISYYPIAVAAAIWTAAPTAVAAPLSAAENQACQYSYDQAWRVVPVKLTGTLRNADTDAELTPGSALAPGQRVRLADPVVSATLPGWIAPFAFDGGVIGPGISTIPVNGWISVEATNTLEGTSAPIAFSTSATSHVNVQPGEAPTEDTAYFDPVVASFEGPTWTATGGDVVVRQAVGTKMTPIPAGRDGSLVQVNGSLFVSAALDANTRLFLDCLAGAQLDEGANHGDKLPDPLSALGFRVPGFRGTVDGAPLNGSSAVDVDAQLENPSVFRGAVGQAVTVDGSRLRLRLSTDQRAAWLGTTGTASVSGDVTIVGERSTVGQQTVTLPSTSVPAAGSGDIVLDVPATTWTPTGSTGVDLRSADAITLQATVGGTPRTLTLQRDLLRPTAYPFAYLLGPDPRTRFEDDTPPTQSPTNPPLLEGPKGFAPPPPPLTKRTTVKIASSRLKRSKNAIKIRLSNLSRTATTTGKLQLVTTSKYRVGKSKKKRTVSLIASRSFSLAKGRSTTYTVKLTKDATTLLKTRKSLKAKLTVTPTSTRTQRTVTRTVTVKR